MMMQPIERTYHVGHTIATKEWQHNNGIPTIALHGWLDNAASFDLIAPLLPQLHLIAMDFPGHGLSSHEPPNAFFHIMDYVIDVIRLADHLGWHQFALLGHSLGAAVASLVAGSCPNRIHSLALIDGLGPMTTPALHAPGQLRLFLSETDHTTLKTPRPYPSVDMAVKLRQKAGTIQPESARILVERGLLETPEGFIWRTDPRLLLPSACQLTENQVLAFLSEITAPVCLIRPEPGYPFSAELIQNRIKAIKNLSIVKVPGHHHVHLDNPQLVAEKLNNFWNRTTTEHKIC